jgi:hypothetical protein
MILGVTPDVVVSGGNVAGWIAVEPCSLDEALCAYRKITIGCNLCYTLLSMILIILVN